MSFNMINRYILKFIFLSFVKAQIALPTFQAVHKPQSSSSSSSLYNFTPHTFTNCGATSTSGPTLANCKSSYDTSWEDNTNYFNVQTQGIQEWTVPKTGTYTIEVWGAAGGGNQYRTIGGRGAKMRGTFSLNQEDKLKILLGQKGPNTSDQYNAGGGGYSGGGGGYYYGNGGGGSSYNSGSDQSNSTGAREDHGQIIITIN